MKLKDSTYDFLKWFSINFTNGLVLLVGTIGVAIQWEHTAVATTIIGAVGSFVAICIGMSKKEYEKAVAEQVEGEDGE